ncbi:MAG TPA: Flp pilus assembly protein CpaB [Vicinamibacterales bacterium]|nr:Flp pilus assembly protein CpaB [Vicinamibacterales bacterium]
MNRRTRTFVVVGVAVALAAVAAFSVMQALQNRPVVQVQVAERHVVVAAREIPVGTMLSPDMVKLVPWPAEALVPGAFDTPEQVVDRGVIDAIAENEPITDRKLAAAGTGAGLPPTIPPGLRAMSVRVNDVISVAGFAGPGTHVDVIVTVTPDRDAVSRVVVSNVQVLAAGTVTEQDQATKDGQPVAARVVTLLVTPQDAERIALAQDQGQIVLALRNPLDVDAVETRGVRMSGLIAAPDPEPVRRVVRGTPRVVTPPPPPPPPAYTVESIRGNTREQVIIK